MPNQALDLGGDAAGSTGHRGPSVGPFGSALSWDRLLSPPVTVVVIGRNAESTLHGCLDSVRTMLADAFAREAKDTGFAPGNADNSDHQVIYVDGGSRDASVGLARRFAEVEIIRIVRSDRFTAALGRHVGLRHARHDIVLFMDADMHVSPSWLRDSLPTVAHKGCVTGQWEEVCLGAKGTVQSRRTNHNGIDCDGPLAQPTGFLMIDRRIVGGRCQFSPLVVNNEEKDFVSQFADVATPWQIARPGFEHRNRRFGRRVKWRAIRSPVAKTGPWVSLFHSVADHRLGAYRRMQPGKLGIVAGWGCIMSAAATASVQWWLAVACLLMGLAVILSTANPRRRGSQMIDAAFFPYKFFGALWLLVRGGTAEVVSEEGSYRLCLRRGKIVCSEPSEAVTPKPIRCKSAPPDLAASNGLIDGSNWQAKAEPAGVARRSKPEPSHGGPAIPTPVVRGLQGDLRATVSRENSTPSSTPT